VGKPPMMVVTVQGAPQYLHNFKCPSDSVPPGDLGFLPPLTDLEEN
jgi:hypothetical protein